MSISYQSKDDKVLSVALKVQELCVKKSDGIVSVSGSDVSISVGESVAEVRAAVHCKDGDASPLLVAQADIDLSVDKVITLTLSAAMADDDAVVVKYVIAE